MSERSSRLGDTRPLPRILAKVVRVALGVRTTVHCLEPLFRIAALRQSGATTLQAANGALVFALRYLCRERPDVAVVPRYEVDRYYASYLAYFSGARVRLGYSTSCTELKRRFTPGYDQLFTKVFTSTAKMHEAERNSEFL